MQYRGITLRDHFRVLPVAIKVYKAGKKTLQEQHFIIVPIWEEINTSHLHLNIFVLHDKSGMHANFLKC